MHRRTLHGGWVWEFYVAAVTVATGLILAWLGPHFHVDETTKRAFTRAYMPLLSPLYANAGSDQITVVTVDDLDLASFHVAWPPQIDFIGRRISQIVSFNPRALFIDIVFIDDRPSDQSDAFVEVLCSAATLQIPVFIATRGAEYDFSKTETKIFEARTEDKKPCALPVDVTIMPDTLDSAQWSYPARFTDDAESPSKSAVPRESAALTIYCNDQDHVKAASCSKKARNAEYSEPLALVWSSKGHPTNVEMMVYQKEGVQSPEAACSKGLEGYDPRDWWAWFWDHKRPCPHNLVVPLRAFNNVGLSLQERRRAICSKFVLVGADATAASDRIVSPIHGLLPAIHVHATALDNLISFDGRYKEAGEFDPWHTLCRKANLFVVLSVLILVGVLSAWRMYVDRFHLKFAFVGPPRPPSPAELQLAKASFFLLTPYMLLFGPPNAARPRLRGSAKLRFRLISLALTPALAVLIFLIGYVWLDQGPLTIIEYVLFPLLAHFLHLGEAIAGRLAEWVSAVRSSDPWRHWVSRP